MPIPSIDMQSVNYFKKSLYPAPAVKVKRSKYLIFKNVYMKYQLNYNFVVSRPQSSNSLEDDIEAVQNISWNDDMTEEAKEEKRKQRSCPGHEICFSVDATVNELDIPEENISTLLCYLELHENSYIKALSKAYVRCKVFSYGGPKVLRYALHIV